MSYRKENVPIYKPSLIWTSMGEGAGLGAVNRIRLTYAKIGSLVVPLQNLSCIFKRCINTIRLQPLHQRNIQLLPSKRIIKSLELHCNVVECQLAQRGAIIDIVAVAVAVAVGAMPADHWMKIIKPVTLSQWYSFYLFLK